MKYLFSDFYLLVGAADKETRTVGDAYRRMAELMGVPVTAPCLLFSLQALCAGGYINLSPTDHMITVTTPISVTPAGKKAATVSGIQKFFGGEFKSFSKNEAKFCTADRPAALAGEDWGVESEGFAEISAGMLRDRDIAYPLFELTEAGEGLLTLTLHHPNDTYAPDEAREDDPDAPAYADSVSVTGDADRIRQVLSDLLAAAHGLLTRPSTRKVALHGADRSFVVTLANTASDEYGTALRMTVSQIRFNRQRFYGKRDGELDYAQCGDPVITHENLNGAAGFAFRLLPCVVARPEELSPQDIAYVEAIHGTLKR